jgi:arylsulfatase A-like enzyme
VPLFFVGPGVDGADVVVDTPAHLADLWPTLGELAGVDVAEADVDGRSLVPWLADPTLPHDERLLYAEAFWPPGPQPWDWHRWSIRDAAHKLAEEPAGEVRLYPLTDGWEEGEGVTRDEADAAQRAAWDALEAARPLASGGGDP